MGSGVGEVHPRPTLLDDDVPDDHDHDDVPDDGVVREDVKL